MVFNFPARPRPPPARTACSAPAARVSALFGFGNSGEKSAKEQEKEEAFRMQQEVLARRRSGAWQKVCVAGCGRRHRWA